MPIGPTLEVQEDLQIIMSSVEDSINAVSDGDKGDILVSNSGNTWTIENMGENATVTTGTYVSRVNQDLLIKVRKSTAGTITKGQVVYIVGSTGNHLTVELARADVETTSAYTIGIAATTITNTSDGFVIQNGRLTGLSTLPTATFADGDAVYLSEATVGGYRVGIPQAPNHGVFLGFVIRANNGSAGEMDVRIQNYQELEELSDVYISGVAANNFLVRNATNTRWENKTTSDVKTTLNLSGTNTGDQTSIVGITGTKVQFNAAVTDGDILYVGDIAGITDGDKGDITVASSGTSWTIDNNAVVEAKINTGAVTETKIGTGAVTETKIGTGAVTETKIGTGAVTQTKIADSAVTLAKQADVATSTVFYRKTAGAGSPEVQTLATLKTDLGLTGTNSGDQTITLTSDVTGSGTGSFATTIANDVVTNAKLANMATATVKGRATAGTGDPEDLAIDNDLTSVSANDDTIPSAKATKTYADTKTPIVDFNLFTNFNTMNALSYDAGRWVGNSINTTSPGGTTSAIDRIEISPFYISRALKIDSIGTSIATASSTGGAVCKVVIYDSDANGMPKDRVLMSANLSTTTIGAVQDNTVNFTFIANKIYWFGIHCNSAAAVRTLGFGSSIPLGLENNTGGNYFRVLRDSITYASTPATWTYSSAQLNTSAAPMVIMKTATL